MNSDLVSEKGDIKETTGSRGELDPTNASYEESEQHKDGNVNGISL